MIVVNLTAGQSGNIVKQKKKRKPVAVSFPRSQLNKQKQKIDYRNFIVEIESASTGKRALLPIRRQFRRRRETKEKEKKPKSYSDA